MADPQQAPAPRANGAASRRDDGHECAGADLNLLARARAGDGNAFADLYATHRSMAMAIAMSVCRQRADAEDVVATAFYKILSAVKSGGGPVDSFDGYLFIAIRRAATQARISASSVGLVEDATEFSVLAIDRSPWVNEPNLAAHAEASARMTSAMATLTDNQRWVLWMVDVMGFSAGELAALDGAESANAVAARTYRARRRLRASYLDGREFRLTG